MLADEIKKAIGTHGVWKARLRTAIKLGTAEFRVAEVARDDQCPFGVWLSAQPPEAQASPHWQSVHRLHAEFHRATAHVLSLALAGKPDVAQREMGPGTPFIDVSTKLTSAMMKWSEQARTQR